MRELEQAENSRAWIDGQGQLHWEDRHHRYLGAHTAAIGTVANQTEVGPVEVACLNAGVLNGEPDPAAIDVERYRRLMAVNVDGVVFDKGRIETETLVYRSATGTVRWVFQTVHHDVWDWDTPTHPILIDVPRDGRIVTCVAPPARGSWP